MYQVDYGDGWKNVHPDGYGMHEENCNADDCEGCWNPDGGDPEVWFHALEEEGTAERARAGDEEREYKYLSTGGTMTSGLPCGLS